ncbi:MAG: hypothetical protein ABFS46_14830 [Myxococcota bacterium]
MLVLRGSQLVRVTGDGRGALSEVILREDPSPPAPAAPEPSDAREETRDVVIEIYIEEAPARRWGVVPVHPVRLGPRRHHRERWRPSPLRPGRGYRHGFPQGFSAAPVLHGLRSHD